NGRRASAGPQARPGRDSGATRGGRARGPCRRARAVEDQALRRTLRRTKKPKITSTPPTAAGQSCAPVSARLPPWACAPVVFSSSGRVPGTWDAWAAWPPVLAVLAVVAAGARVLAVVRGGRRLHVGLSGLLGALVVRRLLGGRGLRRLLAAVALV